MRIAIKASLAAGALLLWACQSAPTAPPPATPSPAPAGASSAAQTPPPAIQDDLVLLTTWFTGRFDNHLQVWQAKGKNTPEELIHEHIHSIFARVEVPAFGPHVFYVKQYMDNDPKKTYRQRLYTFEPSPDQSAIVLRIFAFPDDAAYMDSHLDPSKLAGLTPDKVRATPGCEVYWKRQGDHFSGQTKEGACRIKSRRSGKMLIISDDLYLDEDEIWIHDRAVDTEGNYVFGHKGNIPHKLRRAREFTGWAASRKTDAAEGAKGKDAYHFVGDLAFHDQGDRIALVSSDGQDMGYTIELAQLVYDRTKVPVLKLAVYEKGEDKKSLAYVWANPEAERIGINLGRMQVGLTLKK